MPQQGPNFVQTFKLPTPYEQQVAEANRRQQLAEMMRQQAVSPLESQMVSGRVVPTSPLLALSKMLEGYMGGKFARQADEAKSAASQADVQNAMSFMDRLQAGKPAEFSPDQALEASMSNAPTAAPPNEAYTPQERQNYLVRGMVGGTPTTKALAQVLMAQKPVEYEGGIKFNQNGRPYMVAKTGEIKWLNDSAITPRDQFNTQTAEGIANRAQGQQHWLGLSAEEEANLRLRERSGEIDARRLQDETGQYVAPVRAAVQPAGMPVQAQGRPAALATALRGGPAAVAPVVPAVSPQVAPAAAPFGLPPVNTAGMSPKQIREQRAKQAETQREAQDALPTIKLQANNAVAMIDRMLGTAGLSQDAINDRFEGATKQPHPGFNAYVGATWRPFSRLIPGTDPATFGKLEEQVKGQSFLEAIGKLRGTGQISEIEGAKATAAINRMDKSMDEKDYIEAAREFQANVIAGMEIAQAKAEGRKPNIPSWTKQYVGGVTQSNWKQ